MYNRQQYIHKERTMKRQREHSQDILDKLEEARKNKQDIGVDYKKAL